MCGRLNVIDNPALVDLCEGLGIKLYALNSITPAYFNRFVRATSPIGIIREVDQKRVFSIATWWLQLEQTENGFKPSKYTSFNTRYDKLNTPRSAGFRAFRHSRCIIPTTGFGETQGKGTQAKYTDFVPQDGALAFGGLCREWVHSITGEVALSCSIITLPPHQKLRPFHQKNSPLMLRQDDRSMDIWLDSTLTDSSVLEHFLAPYLPKSLWATQIDKPSTYNPISEPIFLEAD